MRFVIIGGMAGRLNDTDHATIDVDISSFDEVNPANFAGAVRELGVRLRVEEDPEGVPFDPDPGLLRQVETTTMITEHGPLDLCFVPAGFPDGYVGLCAHGWDPHRPAVPWSDRTSRTPRREGGCESPDRKAPETTRRSWSLALVFLLPWRTMR